MAEHFSLRWNNFHRNMSSGFRTLLMEDSLVDVTLAADGRFVQAHRLILSVCSPYFKKLFSTTPCSHPIVVMKDVHFKQLTDILSFMYQGEVNVHQEELADFLKTAELLQIRGLAEQNVEDVNVTTFKHASSQSACSESSGTLPSNSQSVLSQGTQSHVRLNRTAFEQKLSAQVGSSANRVPAAAQSMLHQRSSTSNLAPQISMKQGPSTSMFIGVQVKEELPDAPSEVDQDIDAHEYLTGESGVDGTSLDAPDVLGIGEAEPTHVVEKNLCTAPSGQDGARKSPERSQSKSDREGGSCVAEPLKKTRHRKQRTIALNKIRRFLVTPKRSRRIAFARKMKGKKQVLLKAGLSSENVADVSKQLSSTSRNTLNTKPSPQNPLLQDHIYAAPATSMMAVCEDDNKVVLEEIEHKEDNKDISKKEFKGQDPKKLIALEDSKDKIDTIVKRKVKANATGKSKKYHPLSNDDKKDETTNKIKNKKITPLKKTKKENLLKNGNSPLRRNNVNKKKIIVVIAAKKTKSAVALARKIQPPIRSRTLTKRPGGIERSGSGATIHLRSSAPQSNNGAKDSTGSATNGQACRHSGCLGCRGGN
ncbi:Broad-complex core protein isoforms 1/2/3/4/5 [Gryllus bimaculatus]|nr:Broad-complex core protein isoforms 1/2/3/4/5 [Gryllus bimaculatus]